MKNTKIAQSKKKRGFLGLFRKSTPTRESKINSLYPNLDEMETAEPINEVIFGAVEVESVRLSKIEDSEQVIVGETANELEDGTVILKPKNVIPRKPVFEKEVDFQKYCDSLFVYLTDNGLSVEMNNIREMFASMSASRLVIVRNESQILAERFIELFSDFIGANYFKDNLRDNVNRFEDLFASGYHLGDAIHSADRNKNRIHFNSMKNVKLESIEEYFEPVLDFVWNPLITCNIQNSNFSSVKEMPSNIWFLILPQDNNSKITSTSLALSATSFELKAKLIEPKEEVYENDVKLSYENLTNQLLSGYDEYYVKESQWKKLDKIEEYLIENAFYKLDNRLFRQLERYTSAYLMFGGDRYQAMDNVLFVKLLPVISLLEIHERPDAEENLFQLFERHFGLENLIASKNLIKEIQETYQQEN